MDKEALRNNTQPITMLGDSSGIPEDQISRDLYICDQYLRDNSQHLGLIFGIPNLTIEAGNQWSTNLETGVVTADVSFFIEKEFKPEFATYAILHEVAAHLREVVLDPEITSHVKLFLNSQKDPQLHNATAVFHNIFSDIAGNKLIHSVLADRADVASELYSQKLFPDIDYKNIPRHLQFLYKVIRQEMIPESTTDVLPEVDQLIDELRDYKGLGDLIKLSTGLVDEKGYALPNLSKFKIWTQVIYPLWLDLFEKDINNPPQSQQSQNENPTNDEIQKSGTSQSSNQSDYYKGEDGSSQDKKSSTPEQSEDESQETKPDFSKFYDDYFEHKHPEPTDHHQIDKTMEDIKKFIENQEQNDQHNNPSKQLDALINQETGHSLESAVAYKKEVFKWSAEIAKLQAIFAKILNDRISHRRTLRGNHADGAILNPDTLAQTYIDTQSGASQPPAYADYEKVESEIRLVGKVDYVFVFDRSGSMKGEKSKNAASSMVICLEALAAMQREVERAQSEHNLEADIDIKTGVMVFNDKIDVPKKLGGGLTEKERLDTFELIKDPKRGNADSHVLAQVEEIETPIAGRQRILIVVSDGKADDKVASQASIERLRQKGWQVFGISIGSDDAVELYSPHSHRIDDPKDLPASLSDLIAKTLII